MVRVAAIDAESLPKAVIVLTAANNMAQANSGHMLVFQPTAINNAAAAEPPRLPVGSMVMYTTQIMAGEKSCVMFVTLVCNTCHVVRAQASQHSHCFSQDWYGATSRM
jgi:hypothetical protein